MSVGFHSSRKPGQDYLCRSAGSELLGGNFVPIVPLNADVNVSTSSVCVWSAMSESNMIIMEPLFAVGGGTLERSCLNTHSKQDIKEIYSSHRGVDVSLEEPSLWAEDNLCINLKMCRGVRGVHRDAPYSDVITNFL